MSKKQEERCAESQELLMLFEAMNEKPIAYHRVYTTITGSITAGILLSQLIYWSKAMKYKEFYKTDADFMEELGMSIKELRNAKKKLVELGFVTSKLKGVPAKTHYTVNIKEIITVITSLPKRDNLDWPKGTNWIGQKGQTNTENTTETTSENKQKKEKKNKYDLAYARSLSHGEQKNEIQDLATQYQIRESDVIDLATELVLFVESKGQKYKNYKSALCTWIRREIKRGNIRRIAQIQTTPEVLDPMIN